MYVHYSKNMCGSLRLNFIEGMLNYESIAKESHKLPVGVRHEKHAIFLFLWPVSKQGGSSIKKFKSLEAGENTVLVLALESSNENPKTNYRYGWKVRQIQIKSNAQHFSQ